MQSAIGRMLEECHPSVTFKEERPLTIQEADFLVRIENLHSFCFLCTNSIK